MQPEPEGVRPATDDDIQAIAEISVRSWRVTYAGLIPQTVLDSLSVERRADGWRRALTTATDLHVVDHDGRVAGFVASGSVRPGGTAEGPSIIDEPSPISGDAGELYAIYVDPEHVRRGIGTQLIQHAERDLAAQGRAEAVLWVLEANEPARRFYEKAGWHHDGAIANLDFDGVMVREIRYRRRL